MESLNPAEPRPNVVATGFRGNWLKQSIHPLLFAFSVALSGASVLSRGDVDWSFAFQPPVAPSGPPEFKTILDMRSTDTVMHSPHIAVTDQNARVLWFQGSQEAVNDVEIWAADLVLGTDRFGEEFEMYDAPMLTRAMVPGQPVLILGNTIQKSQGNLDQYIATVVSAGGWAAASLAQVHMLNGQPVMARKLPLSPFLNRSNLVRNGAVMFGDGDFAIPAYHELAAGFGLMVRLGPDGRVHATSRMGFGKAGIQPEIVVTGPKTAVAFLRPFDRSKRLFRTETLDGGQNWSMPLAIEGIGNPDAPVAALLLSDGAILMAANADANTDHSLSLLVSRDQGISWQEVSKLENPSGKRRAAVRYPDMERLSTGEILLTYSTGSKRGIRAHLFTEAWVLNGG